VADELPTRPLEAVAVAPSELHQLEEQPGAEEPEEDADQQRLLHHPEPRQRQRDHVELVEGAVQQSHQRPPPPVVPDEAHRPLQWRHEEEEVELRLRERHNHSGHNRLL
jgi:hypothetical protein